MSGDYLPIFELKRGNIVESVHCGAVAVVDSTGKLLASHGNPYAVTFLRSSAKPFQALPFIEMGGDQVFHLTSREIAILCASHDGTDDHVAVIKGIQEKAGVQESDLQCGVHLLSHPPTVEAMRSRSETLTPNRNNCSGKHTGMLAHARMRNLPIADYMSPEHPVQKTILEVLSEMVGVPVKDIETGIDGCSVPTFAIPLYNAALGFARLCDPRGLSIERTNACRRITASMMAHPEMVAGPGDFDTRLMEIGSGRILAKGGAEGFMSIGIMPGVRGSGTPGVGIAFKIADGDLSIRKFEGGAYNRVRPAVGLAILRHLEVISDKELEALAEFGPVKPVTNHRKIVTGESYPALKLEKA